MVSPAPTYQRRLAAATEACRKTADAIVAELEGAARARLLSPEHETIYGWARQVRAAMEEASWDV